MKILASHRSALVAAVLLTALLGGSVAAHASSSSGVLTALDAAGRSITLRSGTQAPVTFQVSQRASIDRNGHRVSLGDLVLGDTVRVNYDAARRIVRHIDARGTAAAQTLRGRITALDSSAGTLTVALAGGGTQTVTVDADTRISRNGRSTTLSQLAVGDLVVVTLRAGSTDVAASITAQGPEQRQAEGTITALAGNQLTLRTSGGGTITLTLTDGTTVMRGDQPAAASDLAVGQQVNVRYSPVTQEISRIVIQDESTGEDQEVTGTVTAVDATAGTLTVRDASGASHTFSVDSSTVVETESDDHGTLADVQVGDQVKVEFDPTSMVASKIEVENGDGEDHEAELRGTVTAVGSSSITVRDGAGASHTFTVNASTSIRIGHDSRQRLSDIHVGDRIEVTYDTTTNVASRLQVDRSGEDGGDGGGD